MPYVSIASSSIAVCIRCNNSDFLKRQSSVAELLATDSAWLSCSQQYNHWTRQNFVAQNRYRVDGFTGLHKTEESNIIESLHSLLICEFSVVCCSGSSEPLSTHVKM